MNFSKKLLLTTSILLLQHIKAQDIQEQLKLACWMNRLIYLDRQCSYNPERKMYEPCSFDIIEEYGKISLRPDIPHSIREQAQMRIEKFKAEFLMIKLGWAREAMQKGFYLQALQSFLKIIREGKEEHIVSSTIAEQYLATMREDGIIEETVNEENCIKSLALTQKGIALNANAELLRRLKRGNNDLAFPHSLYNKCS